MFGVIPTITSGPRNSVGDAGRSVGQLVLDQVEYANVILVSRCDLVADDERASLSATLAVFHPAARIYPMIMGEVELESIMNTGLFGAAALVNSPGWRRAMDDEEDLESEVKTFGVLSTVYRARVPVHPLRVLQLLGSGWGMVANFGAKATFGSGVDSWTQGCMTHAGSK